MKHLLQLAPILICILFFNLSSSAQEIFPKGDICVDSEIEFRITGYDNVSNIVVEWSHTGVGSFINNDSTNLSVLYDAPNNSDGDTVKIYCSINGQIVDSLITVIGNINVTKTNNDSGSFCSREILDIDPEGDWNDEAVWYAVSDDYPISYSTTFTTSNILDSYFNASSEIKYINYHITPRLQTQNCIDYTYIHEVTIHPQPNITTDLPIEQTFCNPPNITPELTVETDNSDNSSGRIWYETNSSGTVFIIKHIGSSYQPPSNNSRYYHAILSKTTDGVTCKDTTNVVNVLKINAPTIDTQPEDITRCVGDDEISFEVEASTNDGSTILYQWQYSNDGSTYVNVGSDSDTYNPADNAGSYRVIVTSSNSCQDTSSVVTNTINSLPEAVIVAEDSYCIGDTMIMLPNNPISTNDYEWYYNSNTNSPISEEEAYINFDVDEDDAGLYGLKVTDSNDCTNTGTKDIQIDSIPIPEITFSPSNSLCPGEILTISSTPAVSDFQWSGPNNFSPNLQEISLPVSETIEGTYNLTVTDSHMCSGTTSSDFNVKSVINSNITVNPNSTICFGSTFTLTATVDNEDYDYKWLDPNNNVVGYEANVDIIADYTNANVIFTLIISDPMNSICPDTTTKVINITPNPKAKINSTDDEFCTNDTISMNATPFGADYQWSGPGINNNNADNRTVTFAAENNGGTYYVTVTKNNCSAIADTIILVHDLPEVTASVDNSTPCVGNIIEFTASPTNLNTYSWTYPSSQPFSSVQSPTLPIISEADHEGTYTLTGTDSNGCSNTADVSVDVIPAPILTTPSNLALCSGENVNFDLTDLGGSSISYTWQAIESAYINGETTNAQNSSLINDYLVNNNTSQLPSIEYNITGESTQQCVSAPVLLRVYVRAAPTLVADFNPNGVEGSECGLVNHNITGVVASNIEANTISWSSNAPGTFLGQDLITIFQPASSLSIPLSVDLTITANGVGACSDSQVTDTYELDYFIAPAISILEEPNERVCENTSFEFDNVSAVGGSLQWTTSGSGTFNNPTFENPTYTPSLADAENGSVLLTAEVTGNVGPCDGETATATYNLFIDQVPSAVANPTNVSICEGNEIGLNASITNGNLSTILWNSSGSGILTDVNTLNPSYLSGSNEGGTDVPVIMTVHGLESCSSSTDNATVTVIVNNNPEIIINSDFECADDRMTFSLTGSVTHANNITISPVGNATLNSNGTFSISGIPTNLSFIITATNNDGCELMTTVDAHTCQCDASFTPDAPITNTETLLSCLDSPIQTFIINNAGGNLIGEWLDANGNLITIGEDFTPTVSEAGEYSYYVRLRNTSSDCPSELVSLTYTILELPVIQTEDKTICSNEDLQLTASTNSTSQPTWLWSGGAGQISNPSVQNPIVTGLTQSTTFTVQLTDEYSCVTLDQVNVTVNAVPSATIELEDPSFNSYCQGDENRPNIIFTFTGGAPYSFDYKINADVVSVPSTEINGNQYILENAMFGTYQLVSIFNGCSGNIATNVVTIIENVIPPVSISGSNKVCEGEQIVLTSNPADYENYIWSGGNASGNNSSIEINNPGTYILQVMDANGCTSSSTHNVTLSKTIAEITLSNATTTEICAGESLNLSATNEGTLDLPYTYEWSPIEDILVGVTVTPTETSQFMVTITNSFGCIDSDTITVTVNNPVEPAISINDKTLCQSDTFEFNVTNYSSFNNITWGSTGSNSGPNYKLGASVNNNLLIVYSTDKKGCETQVNIDDLVVYALPAAVPQEDNFTIQVNESEVLELENVFIDSKCAGSVLVNWYRDGVLVQSNSSYTYLFEAESADLGQSIVYTAQIQDNCSCESTEVEFFINVVESEDCRIDFVNENVNKGCVGSTYTLKVKGSSEKFDFNEAFWAISKDKIDTTQIHENNLTTTTWEIEAYNSVSNQDGIAESTFIVHFSEPGVYRVFYSVIFGDCTTTRSRKIEVFDLPEFNVADVEFENPFCFDVEVFGELKLNLEDGPLYKLNYALNGVTTDYIFNAGNNAFKLGKQDPGTLSIEFRSLSAEIDDELTCTNYLNPFPIVEVEVLNQFEINKVSECKGDSIQYTINLNYGKKPYSLHIFNYSTGVPKNFTIEDQFFISEYYPTSDILELGANSECKEEEIKLTLDDKCLECVPDFDLIFANSNIDSHSDNLLVCTNSPYLISITGIEYDTTKYRMLAVVQKNDFGLTYNENNIEYVIDTFDTKNFEITLDYAVLKEYLTVSADVKYNIVLYPLPRFTENSTAIKATPCDGKAIKFGFTYPPISEIIYAQDTICQNQASILLEASGQGVTEWILDENYEGEVYYVGDNLYLDFSEQNPSDGFDFVLKKDVGACNDHDTLTIHISEDENKVAPEVKDIYGYPGGIFIYEEDGLCYLWGVEGITGTIPDSLINKKYFFFSDLSNEVFNSVTHRVYVDVRYPEGDLCNECVNRIYYNLLTPPKFIIDPNSPYNWSIYPNPAHDILMIDIAGFKNTKFEGSLYAITGQLIETNLIDKNSLEFQYKWDISNLANGIYILKITDEYGNIKIEKIIKN